MEIHSKKWGEEVWVENNDKYCGKLLRFNAGKKCSYHYHKLKTETFLLHYGKMIIRFGLSDDISQATELVLNKGERFHVPIGLRHQMEAIEDSELIEFSTTHFEEDSYRITESQ
jgi:mannose-6-phosphate isomerase-like protein (cupin superfamily)